MTEINFTHDIDGYKIQVTASITGEKKPGLQGSARFRDEDEHPEVEILSVEVVDWDEEVLKELAYEEFG